MAAPSKTVGAKPEKLTDVGIEMSKSSLMKKEIEKIFQQHGLKVTPARLMSIMWSSDSWKSK